MNDILKAREDRSIKIGNLLKLNEVVISIKANIPGDNKNTIYSYLILNAFSFLINKYNFKFDYYLSDDGPFVLIKVKQGNPVQIKKDMIEIEDYHPLGRLIDIDVHSLTGQISRQTKRKCYICGEVSAVCIREKIHSIEEINSYIEQTVKEYYEKTILNLAEESILEELNLHPKFGLVTPKTSGSHQDMDYNLMIKAKDAILPKFSSMFFIASESKSISSSICLLKKVGISAETDMFKATNNVNCYKGLIFNLGIIIASMGYKFSRFEPRNLFEISKSFAENLFNEYNYDNDTYGDMAYRNYKIKGIKGESLSGFYHVRKELQKIIDLNIEDKTEILVDFIREIEDTSFLKRAKSIDFYKEVKDMFKNLDVSNDFEVDKLNDFCIKNNLSFGGSADLLIVLLFIKKTLNLWPGFTK